MTERDFKIGMFKNVQSHKILAPMKQEKEFF